MALIGRQSHPKKLWKLILDFFSENCMLSYIVDIMWIWRKSEPTTYNHEFILLYQSLTAMVLSWFKVESHISGDKHWLYNEVNCENQIKSSCKLEVCFGQASYLFYRKKSIYSWNLIDLFDNLKIWTASA